MSKERRALLSDHTQASHYLPFMSHVRYLMILFVLVLHACVSYTNYPFWFVHDSGKHWIFGLIANVTDVFMLPVLFFIAGYFTLPSLQRKGKTGFIKNKLKRLGIPFTLGVTTVAPPVLYLNEYQHFIVEISSCIIQVSKAFQRAQENFIITT